MNLTTLAYLLYLCATGATLLLVSRMLFRHGHAFLEKTFETEPGLADAVGASLRTHFRLLGLAAILLLMGFRDTTAPRMPFSPTAPGSTAELFEALSVKLGVALLLLGALHFLSLRRINHIRTNGDLY